jgi:excisionase family DNA binding protein
MEDTARPIGLAEAAQLLGVNHATLRAQVHRGRLQALKVGRDWIVTRAEVERYRAEVQRLDGRRDR